MRDLLIAGATLADGATADLGIAGGQFVAAADLHDPERIDADGSGEPVGRPLAGRLRATALDVHRLLPRDASLPDAEEDSALAQARLEAELRMPSLEMLINE